MPRKRIWVRLAVVAGLLAVIAGGSIFLVERAIVAQRVLDAALDEARSLVEDVEPVVAAANGSVREDLRRRLEEHVRSEHVAKGRFILIEIYDLTRAQVISVGRAGTAAAAAAADARQHAFMLGESPDHARFEAGGESYLQVFAPLRELGRTVAYFEGVYQIDPDALQAMNRGLLTSVILVVVVVLAAAAVLYPVILSMNGDLLRVSGDLAHANMGMLAALGSAVAKRDRGTNSHNFRVTIYAIRLAEAVGLSPDRIRALIKGAFLHDVGKIAISDVILQKPGRLTEDEAAIMKAHVLHGVEIVGKFRWLADAVDVVRHHHEKMDGSGYPDGLHGERIPVIARIFAIVDVFDALTTRRPYKEAAPLHEAIYTMLEGKAKAFDPALLEAFLEIAPELHRTVCGAGDAELAHTLDRLLAKYFAGEGFAPPWRRRDRAAASASAEADLEYLSGTWSLRPEGAPLPEPEARRDAG